MSPGYWVHETGGELAPAIVAYLKRKPLTQRQIHLIRLYLSLWIGADTWMTPELPALRKSVAEIETVFDIDRWLQAAMEEGIDPL